MKFLACLLFLIALVSGPQVAFDFAWQAALACVVPLLGLALISKAVQIACVLPGQLLADCNTVFEYFHEAHIPTRLAAAAGRAVNRIFFSLPAPESESDWLRRHGWQASGNSMLGHLKTPNGSFVRARIEKVGDHCRTIFVEQPFPHPCVKYVAPLQGYVLNPGATEVIPRTLEQAARTTTGWLFENWNRRAG